MSLASRHGRLRVHAEDDGTRFRRLEDLLTADVFGAYRYLPSSASGRSSSTRALLRAARCESGRSSGAWNERADERLGTLPR